jgi:cysteine desulfurase
MTISNRIFLDYQSTTPTDPRVVQAMLPYFTEQYGNPHSVEHSYGLDAQEAINKSLHQLADVFGASATDIVLTSGATEANNLALRGLLPLHKKAHLISCVTEHRSVLGTLAALEREGHQVTLLPVDGDGLIDLDAVEAAFRPNTSLVTVMAVNSEIGVIQSILELGQLCHSRGVAFHTDAAQAFGKIDIDVSRGHIDMMSFSAHKIYGPKGIGALYVHPSLRKRLRPLITGGDQQGGLRAGTVPTPLAVGFGVAAALMRADGAADAARIRALRERLMVGLQARLGVVHLNGSAEQRIVGNLNLRIDGVDADSLLLATPELAISTGSACSAGALEPSSVLLALGLSTEQAGQSFRLGLGRMTTESDVDIALERIAATVSRLLAS